MQVYVLFTYYRDIAGDEEYDVPGIFTHLPTAVAEGDRLMREHACTPAPFERQFSVEGGWAFDRGFGEIGDYPSEFWYRIRRHTVVEG